MKNKTSILQKQSMVVIVAIFCCLLWGSAFPCIKVGYQLFEIPAGDSSSQILFAGIRFMLAGFMVIFAGSLLQGRMLKPSKDAISKVLKLCMVQTVMQYIFFYIGVAHITGVKGSIVNAVNVFFTILVSCLLFRLEKLDKQKMFGCIIGFAGVVIVNLGGQFDMSFTFLGDGFLMISAFAYALSSVLIKIYGKDEDPVMLSGYQFAAGGMIMIAAGLLMGGRLNAVTIQGIGLLLYMAFISAGAYTLWSLLLKYNPVSKVAVFGFCTPIFGVILSALILGEGTSFKTQTLLALALVCVGIISVNYKKSH
jgi:drug/metabolite transporter (DMT)-like permease